MYQNLTNRILLFLGHGTINFIGFWYITVKPNLFFAPLINLKLRYDNENTMLVYSHAVKTWMQVILNSS